MSNDVLSTILNHRSIRKFTGEPLSRNQIETIVKAAQMASSSSFMQSYSIIGITDPSMKRELREITETAYMEENGHLFLFCADFHRITVMASEEEKIAMRSMLQSSYFYQIAVTDASLAAQNAALAAESLGLGIVIMGSVLNAVQRLDEMLGLPEYVIPLFGMAVGVPDQQPEIKPRLPMESVYFENRYGLGEAVDKENIQAYDAQIREYYMTRSENKQDAVWSRPQIKKLTRKAPLEKLTLYVKRKGLNVT